MLRFLVILNIFLAKLVLAQTAQTINHGNQFYDINFSDFIAKDNCGFYVSGNKIPENLPFVYSLNQQGEVLWTCLPNYSPFLPATGIQTKIAKANNGVFLISGPYGNNPSGKYLILSKIDSTGIIQWTKSIEGAFYNFINLSSNDDYVYTKIHSYLGDSLKLYKIDNQGNEVWGKSFKSTPPFNGAPTYNIFADQNGNLSLFGGFGYFVSEWITGNHLIQIDNLGQIQLTKQILSSNVNLLYQARDFIVKDQNYYCLSRDAFIGGSVLGGIRLQKINPISGTITTKTLSKTGVDVSPIDLEINDQNNLVISGYTYQNNLEYGFHLEVDTNLNLLQAYQFGSGTDSITMSFFKTIPQCGKVNTIGNMKVKQRKAPILIQKNNLSDQTCFQTTMQLDEFTSLDSIVDFALSEYTTNSWTFFSATHSVLPVEWNYCDDLAGIKSAMETSPEIKIFPNPASTKLSIESDVQWNKYSIFDFHGREIYCAKFQNEIDISFLVNGLYIIELTGENKKSRVTFTKN
jgi:hypothetical protein